MRLNDKVSNWIIAIFTAATIGWMAWLTSNALGSIRFQAEGGRFTLEDANQLRMDIITEIRSNLPPRWLIERIELMGNDHKIIMKQHLDYERRLGRIEASRGKLSQKERSNWHDSEDLAGMEMPK